MFVVDLQNVLKQFHNGSEMKILFNNMNLRVSEGELVVITGAEQSGKSTLLRMIAAMTPPNKGTIQIFGEDILSITRRPEWRLETIGFVTDEGCLIPYLTAKQNVLIGVSQDDPLYPKMELQAEQILTDLGFTDALMNETLEGLDTKEQILTTIARIYMTNPKLILADDPTKELTGEEGYELLTQLMRFVKKKGSTVIMTSNDPTIIEGADRVLQLENCQLSETKRAAQ
ncbi:ATP-binding cassette domain-containing protein [Evansella sp. AB-rgal1]|uniref:ATP-binding cassette domain-containing protein n=1 Tax=Evansella sp. AB-rgal1 TaxID=3242696 RepID=UPI00359D6F35